MNTDAAGGQADGGRRFSRHMHTSTKHYTPPLPAVRKKEGNKKVARQTDDNPPPPKRVKNVAAEPSNPKPHPQEKTHIYRWLLPIYSANPSCKRGLPEDNGGGKVSGKHFMTATPFENYTFQMI